MLESTTFEISDHKYEVTKLPAYPLGVEAMQIMQDASLRMSGVRMSDVVNGGAGNASLEKMFTVQEFTRLVEIMFSRCSCLTVPSGETVISKRLSEVVNDAGDTVGSIHFAGKYGDMVALMAKIIAFNFPDFLSVTVILGMLGAYCRGGKKNAPKAKKAAKKSTTKARRSKT